MRKKTTKIISFLLILSFIFGHVTGCGNIGSSWNNREKASGTQAAKLLLADKRLDTDVLNESINTVFGNTNSQKVSYGSTGDIIYGSLGRFNLSFLNQIGTCHKSGNTYEWSNFGDYSNISSFFESYKIGVESTVQQTIEMIERAKTEISITDVWVGEENYATMLSVDETSDTLYERGLWGYRICKRYTNNEAQNVYEMYQRDVYEDGSGGCMVNMVCIPDQLYEFSLTSLDGSNGLFLIMENTRGYWNMLCISDFGEAKSITNIMTASDVSYVFDYYILKNESTPIHSILKMLTADRSCDLIGIYGDSITLYPSGFNGIKCLRVVADDSEVSHGQAMSSSAQIMELDGHYSTNLAIPSIVLSNGTVINPDDAFVEDTIRYQYGNVTYGADGYNAFLDFMVEGDSLTEKLSNFKAFLTANGISCKANLDSIISYAPNGDILLNQFLNSYTWNGYTINSDSKISSAIKVELDEFDAFNSMYNTVENYELISYDDLHYSADVSDLDFAALNSITMGNVTFDDYKISISDMSFTLSDMTLIEANTNYTIQLGYAIPVAGEDGTITYDPCSIYPFESENKVLTTYTGEEGLVVTQNAAFNSYYLLNPETYHVVAYVTTEDGIRVSQVVPVVFSSDISVTDTLPLVNLSINTNENKNMVAVYAFNHDIAIELEETKENYSYNEVYQFLLNGVLSHGELVNTTIEISTDDNLSDWKILNENETVSSCVVRMKYTKNTDNGTVEGYIYIPL